MFAVGMRRAFSLIELVIVVVIIGIIGAIAIPRMSRGSEGAADSALAANLAVLRNAVDLYATEHGGSFPALATFEDQLVKYTDASGTVSATKTSTAIYGPYLRAIPTLPVGTNKGKTTIAAAYAANVGWVYNETTGVITAGTNTETDKTGKAYNTY